MDRHNFHYQPDQHPRRIDRGIDRWPGELWSHAHAGWPIHPHYQPPTADARRYQRPQVVLVDLDGAPITDGPALDYSRAELERAGSVDVVDVPINPAAPGAHDHH